MSLTLTAAQYGLFAFSVVALLALLAVGRTPERIAAATLTLLMFASPYLAREGPVPVAIASGFTLAVLVMLTLRYERWWLIGAAGVQLVVFSTHFAPLLIPQSGVWPAVTLRIILWGAQMALCVFAIGECRWTAHGRR